MFDLEIKAKGFDRSLQQLGSYDQIATQENKRAMTQGVKLVERVGKQKAPVNFGELRAKIHGEVRQAGPGLVLGVVGSYAKPGAAVEEGSQPHWPNIRSLGLWVYRKLHVGRDEVRHVTFLIARAISRSGTRAQPYLEPAFEENQNKIKHLFEQALENIVKRLGSK